ncbi:MAG: methyltransferase domain-containing protein [Chloroflexi bacterium]|jgi:ubiquinone/menaquinone biosynthesis C-methylase UbiE|nr:methyltransferase domain-containing protein [Chloroflexota bacterium]MBT7080126.1 methyltransferase domain-containing protein [Chloroflexota bacterium]MBT7290204.1 methyltransferase domain-containing protein [Chloroflexota bacterium]
MNIEPEILEYYQTGKEVERLFTGVYQLERVRTQEIITRYLTDKPLKTLDVGGAAGFYSFWLSDMGHDVHLVDPVPFLIEHAKKHSVESGKELASITVGDARQLEFDDDHFDVVLLLGPLYYLTERSDRITALLEAKRVLRMGGTIFCVGVSRYASTFAGFFQNLVADPRFIEIMNGDLKEGQHRNTTEALDYWTTAYVHRPEELKDEMLGAGFAFEKLLAIESFGWLVPILISGMMITIESRFCARFALLSRSHRYSL